MRIIDKDNFDSTYRLHNNEFNIGDIILIFDFTIIINISTSKKFNYRWIGLYRIIKSDSFKGIYKVSELDGVVFRDMYADNRLKPFYVTIILDVFSRYRTPASFNDKNNIVNFADVF